MSQLKRKSVWGGEGGGGAYKYTADVDQDFRLMSIVVHEVKSRQIKKTVTLCVCHIIELFIILQLAVLISVCDETPQEFNNKNILIQ